MQLGDKFSQLHYVIQRFNNCAYNIFVLGPNTAVDEGVVAMQSSYFPVRQYNKNKLATF